MEVFVAKVKYQGTLRYLRILDNRQRPASLEVLTSHIRELFNIAPNASLAIAFPDDDGDLVTMSNGVDVRTALERKNRRPWEVSLAVEPPPPLTPPTSAMLDGREGSDAIMDAMRALMVKFERIPAATSALSNQEVMEVLIELGAVLQGLGGLMHHNITASGST